MIFPQPQDAAQRATETAKDGRLRAAADRAEEGVPPGSADPSHGRLADRARFLVALFRAMVAAADPARVIPALLPQPPRGRTVVVGAGKAGASMARAVEEHWKGPLTGLVVTRYGHGTHCCSIEVIEAGHPLPDEAGTVAASRMLTLVESLTSEDLVIVLVSGGGSALLTLPAPGLTLEQVREVNRRLLASGAPIADINCVRKHLSAITGGRLSAAAWPAEVLTLAISDVPGDDPAVIASGPTVADPSTFADALAVVARYRLTLPEPVLAHLLAGREETPKPGDSRLTRSRFVLAATAASGLAAAAAAARRAGIEPVVLGADIQGEARLVAVEHAELVRRLIAEAPPGSGPLLVLSGGETTVTVDTGGRGGRNAEYLLAFALALEERGFGPSRDEDEASAGPSVYAVAADTDGVDGTEDNAGASLYPDTLARARAGGIDPQAALAAHDSYGVFAALGDVLVTGPTRTNVNDFRGILVV